MFVAARERTTRRDTAARITSAVKESLHVSWSSKGCHVIFIYYKRVNRIFSLGGKRSSAWPHLLIDIIYFLYTLISMIYSNIYGYTPIISSQYVFFKMVDDLNLNTYQHLYSHLFLTFYCFITDLADI